MTSDGADPRLDATPMIAERRLHPAYMAIRAGRTGRTLVPVAALAIWRWPWWVLVGIVLAVVALSAAWWWQHRYQVSDGYLRVRAGLVRRTADAVPLTRITALDARRSLVQRLFAVWELKVQVPGDGVRSAVVLPCLSSRRLAELRAALDPAGRVGGPGNPGLQPTPEDEIPGAAAAPPPATSAEPSRSAGDRTRGHTLPEAAPEVTLARLDLRTLLVTAVTGTSVPLIVAGGFAAWNRARELLPKRTIGWAEREVFSRGAATVGILGALFLLAVVVSVGITSLRLAGFTLSRQGEVLRIRRGLLTEHSGTVVVDRVQAVRLVEGLWRRALGYAAIEVEVAGVAGSAAERLMFPLIRTADAVELIRRALPELAWIDGPLRPAPRRARRRYYTIPMCWAAGTVLAAVLLLPGWGPWLGVLPIPFALLVGRARAGAAAWGQDEDTVTLRWHRVFTRHTLVARRRRVQITRVTRSVWQRRAGLAGFHATLSTRRTGSVAHLELSDADLLQRTTGRRDPVPAR
jgi:putative membrane protein